MPRPTLDETFRSGPPQRTPVEHHGWLTGEERRFILWGFKERWSAARIGRALGVNEATVRRFRETYWGEPEGLLELGLYEMVGRARDQEFKCLVCEEKVQSKTHAERHVLSHYLEKPAVDWVMEERTVVTRQEAEDEQTEEEDDQEPRRRRRKRTAGLRDRTVQQYSPRKKGPNGY